MSAIGQAPSATERRLDRQRARDGAAGPLQLVRGTSIGVALGLVAYASLLASVRQLPNQSVQFFLVMLASLLAALFVQFLAGFLSMMRLGRYGDVLRGQVATTPSSGSADNSALHWAKISAGFFGWSRYVGGVLGILSLASVGLPAQYLVSRLNLVHHGTHEELRLTNGSPVDLALLIAVQLLIALISSWLLGRLQSSSTELTFESLY